MPVMGITCVCVCVGGGGGGGGDNHAPGSEHLENFPIGLKFAQLIKLSAITIAEILH